MESTPLQFARDFERLKSDLSRVSSRENAILELARFWQNLKVRFAHPAYTVYVEEYLQMLVSNLDENNLGDLTIEELAALDSFLAELTSGEIPARFREAVMTRQTALAQQYARKLLYVGDYKNASAALKVQSSLGLTDDEVDGKSEAEILHLLCGKAAASGAHVTGFLRSVLTELEFAKDNLQQNSINCLFVERDDSGNSTRGRLRVMKGSVRTAETDSPSHEVTFEGQIKTPNDPFVGVAYDALDAIKAMFRSKGEKGKAEAEYHAHYSIQESKQNFTGDSIGLAFALLAYAQLVKNGVARHERMIPGDIAVTGSIDKGGRILPVNEDTLKYKIERAFFSSVKYLVLPSENHPTAVKIVKELQGKYPHRPLRLVAVERLTDATDDRNIIRAEKVCPIDYATRVAVKFARYKSVQIPTLLALGYLLVCLTYPKAWIWFDSRIDHIEVIDKRFRAVNKDGHTVFTSDEHEFPLEDRVYTKQHKESRYLSYDADNDERDELFFLPYGKGSWAVTAVLQYYESDGTLKWSKQTYEATSYPGDSEVGDIGLSLNYATLTLMSIIGNRGKKYVMSVSVASMPARCQFILFDTAGNKVSGPYLHTGHMANDAFLLSPGIGERQARLMIGCVNNRMDRAGMIVIDPFCLEGVSPPYDDNLFLMSGMPRGSQLYYVGFPETEISAGSSNRNMIISIKKVGNEYEVAVQEGSNEILNRHYTTSNDTLMLPSIVYVLDSNFIPMRAYFADRCLERYNYYLSVLGRGPLADPQELLQNMLNDVIVYRGDSIVYHPATGIHPSISD